MSKYGATVNCSYIQDENGNIDLGFNFSNSDGKEINLEKTGTSLEEIITDLYTEVFDLLFTEDEPEEPNVDFLMEENKQLREEIQFLRDQLQVKNKKEKPKKKKDDPFTDLVELLIDEYPSLKWMLK